MRVRLLFGALWTQVIIGFASMVFALNVAYDANKSWNWTMEINAEYASYNSRQLRLPPPINGIKHDFFPSVLKSLAEGKLHTAGFLVWFSGLVTGGGALMLFLAYRAACELSRLRDHGRASCAARR